MKRRASSSPGKVFESPSRSLTALDYLQRPDVSYAALTTALAAAGLDPAPLPNWELGLEAGVSGSR